MQGPGISPPIPTSTSTSISGIPRRLLTLHIYTPSRSQWTPLSASSHPSAPLPRGTTLNVLSWNIDMSYSSHSARTTKALDYLASILPSSLPPTILMFQEMSRESLAAILAHSWTRLNFIISNKTPPEARYFTLLLVSKSLQTGDWFRVSFEEQQLSMMGRDMLGVDVLVSGGGDGEGGDGGRKMKCVRISTTHLESLGEEPGYELRPKQLAIISGVLKEKEIAQGGVGIVGGLVGGDMNAISEVDYTSHRRPDVELRDVWEERIGAAGSGAEDGGKGLVDGNEEDSFGFGSKVGHTWGYQPRSRWPPERLDKFLVTGDVRVVKLDEIEDCSGDVGRLGVGLKTESGLWVSDHFGIAVGVNAL